MLTLSEKEELEQLRRSASKFMTDPLERAFFELQSVLERPVGHRVDEVMPCSAFRVLARAVIELKRSLDNECKK